MAESDATSLEKVDLFSGFSKRALQRLRKHGKEVQHNPGHEVSVEGGYPYAFHLILEGSASVTVAGQSRPELGPGDYFGEISLIDGKPRSATVTAGKNGLRAFALSTFEFNAMLDSHPEVARSLLVNLCARVRSIEAAARE
jgi:CRP/FNR family transcriptional regulator, cyclic AMP receptor protein